MTTATFSRMFSRLPLAQTALGVTNMIRLDHTHVMLVAHRYGAMLPAPRKRVIADMVCTALEVHAQLEEEIFYPALRDTGAVPEAVAKAPAEHAEMRRVIAQLREMDAADAPFDDTFMTLIRDVQHHVADEETVLLPAAEQVLGDRLAELGARMTARRLQLLAPRAREVAMNGVRTLPPAALVAAGALLLGGLLIGRSLYRPRS